jgi:hypothetical protein
VLAFCPVVHEFHHPPLLQEHLLLLTSRRLLSDAELTLCQLPCGLASPVESVPARLLLLHTFSCLPGRDLFHLRGLLLSEPWEPSQRCMQTTLPQGHRAIDSYYYPAFISIYIYINIDKYIFSLVLGLARQVLLYHLKHSASPVLC